MNSKRLKQLAANPNNIPGVYNYCDRWCERCTLSSRCLNYAIEREETAGDPAARDMENEKFWETMHSSFALTMEMIAEECEEQGLDFAEIQREAASQESIDANRARRKARNEHPLLENANRYMKRVSEWFKTREDAFAAKAEELASAHLMSLPGHDPEAAARDLHDAVEIIRWYHMFVCAKLARAIGPQDEDEEEEPQSDEIQTDSNGSAKIALIAIDRSLAAWSRLRDHLPSEGDEIIDVLTQLNRLKKQVEQTFPKARVFVRPGFDEGTTA